MTITQEETLNKAIWWVLQELQKENIAKSSPKEQIYFNYQKPTDNSNPSINDQVRAINFLDNDQVVKIISSKYYPPIQESTAKMIGIRPMGIYLYLLPKFNEVYSEFQKHHIRPISDQINEEESAKNRPYCVIEKGVGYLKFGKHGAKKKIGSANSIPFKFLQVILEPLGTFKSVEAVFTTIWMERYSQDSRLTNPNTSKSRRAEILKNSAIKELQKDNKLAGKIKFEFNESETQVRAIFVD